MSKIMRVVVMVTALMSLFGVMSATAGAVTWHNTGNTAFTATGGAGTLSSTGVSLVCTSSDATGTAPASVVGATYTSTGTATFTGCRLAGLAAAVSCNYSLTGTAFSAGVTSGTVDATCSVSQAGVAVCHIAGTTPGSYTNPGTAGRLTLSASSSLRTFNPASGTCPLGNGDTASLTQQVFTVTGGTGGAGTVGPVINRTA